MGRSGTCRSPTRHICEPEAQRKFCQRYVLPLEITGADHAVGSLFVCPGWKRGKERPGCGRTRAGGEGAWDEFEIGRNCGIPQDIEFLFLSQRARLAAFGGSIAPKTPVLKLSRPLARKPPAAIAGESTRVACAPLAKPQVAGLRHRWSKRVVSGGLLMSWRTGLQGSEQTCW